MLGLVLNGRHSDRKGERLWHIGFAAAAAGVALLVAAILQPGWWVLALITLAGTGIGASQGVFWALPSSARIGGAVVPVGIIALISMFGTAGGIAGPWLIGETLARTGSFAPAIIVLATLLVLTLPVLLSGQRSLALRHAKVPR
jgi:ACS family tartrate transporter-like MFS transporter